MRKHFDSAPMDGVVVIGEGEMDEAPMLYIGARREPQRSEDGRGGGSARRNGNGGQRTEQRVIRNRRSPRGTLLHAPDIYMHKLAVGPELAGKLSLNDPIEVTLRKHRRSYPSRCRR